MLLLDTFCSGLDLTDAERASVRALHTKHNNQLQHLHYPPISEKTMAGDLIGGIPAHTDSKSCFCSGGDIAEYKPATFTLLFQNPYGGLEFENRTHEDHFMKAVPQGDHCT